jgi:hypothetical protein
VPLYRGDLERALAQRWPSTVEALGIRLSGPAPVRRDVALAVEVFQGIVERSHISDPVFLDTRLTNHGGDQGGRDGEEVAEADDDAGLRSRSALAILRKGAGIVRLRRERPQTRMSKGCRQ